MKKIAQVALLFVAILGISQTANSAVLIEPVLGYNFAKVEAGSDDDNGTGVSFGGRLGYQNLGFQLGLDYLQSSIKFDDTVDMKDWAAFVGFEFPVLIRAYAGYIFSSDAGSDMEKGKGTKFGLGFTGLPFVDINLEYRMIKYEIDFPGAPDVDFSSIMLGVSVPFTI